MAWIKSPTKDVEVNFSYSRGQGGYITPAAWGVPTASERGSESEVAHKWARWLHNPCLLGGPSRFRAGGRIRGGPDLGKVATSPLPTGGSPPLQSGGQNRRWPTSGQGGYITPAVWGFPTPSERGAESEVAHKGARWLHNPFCLGGPHRFRVGVRIRGGPELGKVATEPLPPGGSPPLQGGGQNQKWQQSEVLGDNIRNSLQVGPVAVRSGKNVFLGN